MSALVLDSCSCSNLDVSKLPQRLNLIQHNKQLFGLADSLDCVGVVAISVETSKKEKNIAVIQVCHVSDDGDEIVNNIIDMANLNREDVFFQLFPCLYSPHIIKVGVDIKNDALAIYANTGLTTQRILDLSTLSVLLDHSGSCAFIRSQGAKAHVDLNSMAKRFISAPDMGKEIGTYKSTFTGKNALSSGQIEYVKKKGTYLWLIYHSLVSGIPSNVKQLAEIDYTTNYVPDETGMVRRDAYLKLYPNVNPNYEAKHFTWIRDALMTSSDKRRAREGVVDHLVETTLRSRFFLSDDDVGFIKKSLKGGLYNRPFSSLVYAARDRSPDFIAARSLCMTTLRQAFSQPNLSFYSDVIAEAVLKRCRMNELRKSKRVNSDQEDNRSDDGAVEGTGVE